MKLLVWAVVLLGLAAAPALASEERPTLAELEKELVCPTCSQTLDMSDAPGAQRMKAYIRERIDEGASKSEIKGELVAQFGEGVLAAPPRRGFNLLAWLLPALGLVVGAAAVGAAAWRWSRRRSPGDAAPDRSQAAPSTNGRVELDPELERRLDEELARFDG
jgi:cytochrome c-type biogenesis protein CcmH